MLGRRCWTRGHRPQTQKQLQALQANAAIAADAASGWFGQPAREGYRRDQKEASAAVLAEASAGLPAALPEALPAAAMASEAAAEATGATHGGKPGKGIVMLHASQLRRTVAQSSRPPVRDSANIVVTTITVP